MDETEEPGCDFCAQETPVKAYACPDFAVIKRGLPPQGSTGPFKACSLCAALVDVGDVEGLIRRYAAGHYVPHESRKLRKQLLTAYWAKFLELRQEGQPI